MNALRIEQQTSAGAVHPSWGRAMEGALTLDRRGKIAVAAGAGLVLAALFSATPDGQQAARRLHRTFLLRELRSAAADAGVVVPYMTEWSPLRAGTLRGGELRVEVRRLAVRSAADALLVAADGDHTAEAHYAAGVARLIKGESGAAVTSFQSAVRLAPNDPSLWAALAEAQRRDSAATGRPAQLRYAIAAAHRSMTMNERLPAARYALAATLDDLGIAAQAHAAWGDLLRIDPASPWRSEFEERLAVPVPQNEVAVWREVADKAANAAKLDDEQLRALAVAHPEIARGWVESQYLTEWARSCLAHDENAAKLALDVSRRLAAEVRTIAGESLGAEAVAVIDDATRRGDADRLTLLARGQIAYQDGRRLVNDAKLSEGIVTLTSAASDLRRGGSPLALVADHYGAAAVLFLDRPAEAAQTFRELLDSEAAHPGYLALRAMSLRELGLSLAFLGRWNEALDALRASGALFEQLGETTSTGLVHLDLSGALDQLGLTDAAWRERVAAFRLFSLTGRGSWIETTLADATLFAIKDRDWDAARAFAALDIIAATDLQAPLVTSRAWTRRAFIEVSSGNSGSGSLAQARALAAAIPDEQAAARRRAEIDVVAAMSVQPRAPRRAAELLARSIDFYSGNGLNVFLPDLYLLRSRAFAAAGDYDAAWRDATTGIDVLEKQREHIGADDLKTGIFDRAGELFDDAVRLALRRGDAPAAFAYAEKGRSRALLDTLSARRPAPGQSIAAAQASLGDGVLVEFHTLPEKLVTFVVSREGLRTFETAVTSAELDRRASELVDRTVAEAPLEELQRLGAELFDMLLAQPAGNGRTPLVIVADGALRGLPFALLYDRVHSEYAVQARPLIFAPSAAIFVDRTRVLAERGNGVPHSALVIGDPAFDVEQFSGLQRLGGSDREAQEIAPLYPRSTVWRAEEATKKKFASQAPNFELLHFGGHAVSNHANPAASFLLFAAGAKSESDSGALYSSEIARMRFPSTRIVVLAACGSLHGDPAGREGLPTIGRSFLEAGVPTVVGTLWPIDDNVAAKPMTDLHRLLARGVPADEAVRAIQMAMLRSDDPSQRHPSHWAAFAVLGAAR